MKTFQVILEFKSGDKLKVSGIEAPSVKEAEAIALARQPNPKAVKTITTKEIQ